MPVVNYDKYCQMLDNAKKNRFAYAAINVTSEITANAVLQALAETKSDGIIQVSTGGGEFASGQGDQIPDGSVADDEPPVDPVEQPGVKQVAQCVQRIIDDIIPVIVRMKVGALLQTEEVEDLIHIH